MNGYDMMVTFEWSWTWQVFFALWDGELRLQDSLEEEFRVALTAAVPVEEKVGLILSEFQVFEVIKLINSTKSKVPCFLDPSCFFLKQFQLQQPFTVYI